MEPQSRRENEERVGVCWKQLGQNSGYF